MRCGRRSLITVLAWGHQRRGKTMKETTTPVLDSETLARFNSGEPTTADLEELRDVFTSSLPGLDAFEWIAHSVALYAEDEDEYEGELFGLADITTAHFLEDLGITDKAGIPPNILLELVNKVCARGEQNWWEALDQSKSEESKAHRKRIARQTDNALAMIALALDPDAKYDVLENPAVPTRLEQVIRGELPPLDAHSAFSE